MFTWNSNQQIASKEEKKKREDALKRMAAIKNKKARIKAMQSGRMSVGSYRDEEELELSHYTDDRILDSQYSGVRDTFDSQIVSTNRKMKNFYKPIVTSQGKSVPADLSISSDKSLDISDISNTKIKSLR